MIVYIIIYSLSCCHFKEGTARARFVRFRFLHVYRPTVRVHQVNMVELERFVRVSFITNVSNHNNESMTLLLAKKLKLTCAISRATRTWNRSRVLNNWMFENVVVRDDASRLTSGVLRNTVAYCRE